MADHSRMFYRTLTGQNGRLNRVSSNTVISRPLGMFNRTAIIGDQGRLARRSRISVSNASVRVGPAGAASSLRVKRDITFIGQKIANETIKKLMIVLMNTRCSVSALKPSVPHPKCRNAAH